jgi:dTDP-4-dehydrorhamnose 3,5-epimerase
MEIIPTSIPDVLILKPEVYSDQRGFFMETYQQKKFRKAGIKYDFVQDNHSGSVKGTLRGLHYQIKHAQGKLVRVVAGEIFDVAVDLRRYSPTFLKWVGVNLSSDGKEQIWIPPGFAHGFYTLSGWAEVIYKATDFYSPKDERAIKWSDPTINIEWPIDWAEKLLISEKDLKGMYIHEAEVYE